MECLSKSKSNIDWSNKFGLQKLQINFMIYCGWWQSRDPTSHHRNIVPDQDACLSCLVTSSSSFPSCRESCLPSLENTSRAAPFQPPKESTAKGMNVMPSAVQRSSYLDILMLNADFTPCSPSRASRSMRPPSREYGVLM